MNTILLKCYNINEYIFISIYLFILSFANITTLSLINSVGKIHVYNPFVL